jgi:hypothetical protein
MGLTTWVAPHLDCTAINSAITKLTDIIRSGIQSHIPVASPSPYSKCWWSTELTILQKQTSHTCHLAQCHQTGEALETWKAVWRTFQQEVQCHKRQHWQDFLASLDDSTLFTASHYATKEQAPHFIPPLECPNGSLASVPTDQANLFHDVFFSPPQEPDLSDIHPGRAYPVSHQFHPL